MNLHDDLMHDAGVELLMDTQGEPVTVALLDGTSRTLTAIVGAAKTIIEDRASGQGKSHKIRRTFTISRDPVSTPSGIAQPDLLTQLEYDGRTYTVVGTETSSVTLISLVAETHAQQDKTRPGFRRP